KYRVVVSGRGTNPESAYEDVNNSTYLEIPSLSDIARKFGEDHKDLDVEKREYADELNKLCRAHGALQKNGMDFNVEISLSVEGETPGEAIESIEDAEVTPVMRREDDEYESTILYVENELSVNTIPQGSSTNKEAL
ncbi:MAG: hypothetical protein ABEI13_01870, partial [Candidatus Paceibacteria bacterium]